MGFELCKSCGKKVAVDSGYCRDCRDNYVNTRRCICGEIIPREKKLCQKCEERYENFMRKRNQV